MEHEEEPPQETSNTSRQPEDVFTVLYGNMYGSDFLLCLFITALQSYRVDRCLRPFPSTYIKDSIKDIRCLRSVCDSIPPFNKLLLSPQICSSKVLKFLEWLLCQEDQPTLHKINFKDIPVPSPLEAVLQPHYTYKILYSAKAEDNWQKRKNSRNTFFAYHGSPLDNFYSIFKVGLQHHLSVEKDLMYGRGIYLATDITISMPYSPFSRSWGNSIMGDKLSVIALCEVIDHLDKVIYKDSNHPERANQKGFVADNIAEKYILVRDSDMIRIRNCGEMSNSQTANNIARASPCESGSHVLYAWARNAKKFQLPDDVGFEIGKNTQIQYLVLQVHYSHTGKFKDGSTDDSGIFLMYTEKRRNKLAGVILLGTGGAIPPNSVTHMESDCRIYENKTIYPFAYRTHTHSLGKVVAGYKIREDENKQHHWTLLGKRDPLTAQMFYPVFNTDPIYPGDILAARCTMKSNRLTYTHVGATNLDEMCNFYLMYYVTEGNPLDMKYCFTQGPPYFYWDTDNHLNNIPNNEASTP
ncbi:hypothetical protein FQA39_LY04475 [Lamprigera yunnana]|nr:hypothetical protein FQA39_LY04475 [Lamprigera yunnana]